MANISDVYGDVEIITSNKKQDDKLITELFNVTSGWYYGAIDISDGPISLKDSNVYRFYSMGRWTFFSSLSDFTVGLREYLSNNACSYLLEHLEDLNGLKLIYDYSEYEPGFDVLQNCVVEQKFIYKDDHLEDEIEVCDSTNYENDAASHELFDFFELPYDTFTEFGVMKLAEYLADDYKIDVLTLGKKLLSMLENEEFKYFRLCDCYSNITGFDLYKQMDAICREIRYSEYSKAVEAAIMSIEESDENFQLSLLGRLVEDLKYYLGYGFGKTDHLWISSKQVSDEIVLIEYLYYKLEPKWLTKEYIDELKTCIDYKENSKNANECQPNKTAQSLKLQ